jgi:DnaJ-domain-containing protein 1
MAPLQRNHYRVLAVAPDASIKEIERSFRQLARRLHPDLNGGDGAAEERMKELNVARATLTDPAARAAYDESLRREQQAKSPPPAAPVTSSPERRPRNTGPMRPLSWARTRVVTAPLPTLELSRAALVSRVLWFTFVAVLGLAIVLGLIWLRDALVDTSP